MDDKLRAYLYLHFCVLLWGFTAILGKLISLYALGLVWWRVLLCSVVLWFMIPRPQLRKLTVADWRRMSIVGVLVAAHWLTFYGAIKLSNASVGVASIALTSFFTALLEPLVLKKRIVWYEAALGLAVIPGIFLIVGTIDFSMRVGFGVGVICAFLASLFSALNKKILEEAPPPALIMTFVELFVAFLACSLVLPAAYWFSPGFSVSPTGWDWVWLPVLAVVCTVLPFYLSLVAMRHISAFATNLTINLEPVYGVLLAILIFREDKELPPGFYLGVLIIMLAVFSHPLIKKRLEKAGQIAS